MLKQMNQLYNKCSKNWNFTGYNLNITNQINCCAFYNKQHNTVE